MGPIEKMFGSGQNGNSEKKRHPVPNIYKIFVSCYYYNAIDIQIGPGREKIIYRICTLFLSIEQTTFSAW